MSAGPIKAARDGWRADTVSTPDAHRVCARTDTAGRGYCGRKAKTPQTDWKNVTCADCHAARRADEEAR